MQALCQSRALAQAGNTDRARSEFQDRAHGFLHELAVPLAERDRAATAELLVAKNRVEAAFAPDATPQPRTLFDIMGALIDATRKGGDALGLHAPECPK